MVPLLIQGFSSIRDKERAAEFYREHPTGAMLPEALWPSGFEGYHWACFGIGVSLVFTGIRESKLASSLKPEKWETAEL